MYPKTFTPSTTVTVNDGYGNSAPGCNAQLFKPLLGCDFNGQQPIITGHFLPNMAAIVLRGLVNVPTEGGLTIKPGPVYWPLNKVPSMVLSEDPNGLAWWWIDALPWSMPDGSKLWSIFACTDSSGSPPPPPPPPPATPVILSTSSPTATLLALNVSYVTTINSGSQGWGYIPIPTGVGYTVNITATSSVGVPLTTSYGNTHALPVSEAAGPAGVGTIVVPGIAHNGPDMSIRLNDLSPMNVTVYFNITSP